LALKLRAVPIVPAVVFATPALAHTGVGAASGFTHGFLHPLGGLDHVFAMIGVGLFAAVLGGRALWLVPLSFVTMMVVGAALGIAGVALPHVEIGIAFSVVALGAMVAFQWKFPLAVAALVVGLFAIFHGHAHGAEMPDSISGYSVRCRLCARDRVASLRRHRRRRRPRAACGTQQGARRASDRYGDGDSRDGDAVRCRSGHSLV